MKKSLYLIPLFLGFAACRAQIQPTLNVADVVNATLTSIAQNNPQSITTQPANMPSSVETQSATTQSQSIPPDASAPSGNITYFWPQTLPEGFILSRENSSADSNGFTLMFINPSSGTIVLSGGAMADKYEYCPNYENNPSEPVMVRGQEGCFPPSTGGGFSVEWKENGTHYSVGGAGVSKEFAIAVTEQLEFLNLSTFLARLVL